jgi:hypothetical protein
VRYSYRDDTGMRRRLLNFLTALSLLVCVAAVALWVRSYWASDWISYVRLIGAKGEVEEGGQASIPGNRRLIPFSS